MNVTDLQHAKLYTTSGKYLGRLFDLRSAGSPEHGAPQKEREITELVYGEIGLFERLGLKRSGHDTISTEQIVEIKDGKIIVEQSKRKR